MTMAAYNTVNRTWPEKLPPMTGPEAASAAKRLYRKFLGKPWKKPIKIRSGNRRSYIYSGALHVNPDQGWHDFIHDLSHCFFRRLHPDYLPHDVRHAFLERDMVSHVVSSGWLDGKLKSKAKPKLAVKKPVVERRYSRAKAALARAEHRKKLAEQAIKRLRTKVRYYEKRLSVSVS